MAQTWQKRRYQERCIENFGKWISNSSSKLATIILPTGTGKTFCASLCIENISNMKVLWVAHREELIDQAYNTLSKVVTWTSKLDIEMGTQKADNNSDIIVGSVQTLARQRKHMDGFYPDLIVIDEYHHRSEKNKTYQGLIDRFDKAKILGLTATPWRFSGEEVPLGEVLFQMDIGTAIEHKYLVPPIPEILKSDVSLANVKTSMGDFSVKELSKAVNVKERNEKIAKRVLELVKEHNRQGILFGVDVSHSKEIHDMLKNEIRVAQVYGDTPKEQRIEIMKAVRGGDVDLFCNNLVCTEGFDAPHLSFAAIARPTRSLGLFCQMVGRVLRTSPNKTNAILVDVYDKLKVKQSRITFSDMASKGDLYGERKRANNILTALIPGWEPKEKAVKSDSVAYKLSNFPIFMINKEQDRWTIDDDFLPISSWIIGQDQRLITWTEEQKINKFVDKITWNSLKFKPTQALIKNSNIRVKHDSFGLGQIIDVGLGLEVKVKFDDVGWGDPIQFVSIEKLKIQHKEANSEVKEEMIKVDKLFYLCFPEGESKGRCVEMFKKDRDLIVEKDSRMTLQDCKRSLVDKASTSGILQLVRADAKWKQSKLSEKQKELIQKNIDNGRIKFDLDIESLTKGDGSAIIEQLKWQRLINDKFGTNDKNKLLGYDPSQDDV